MKKRLVHEKVVKEAETLLAEALSPRRRLRAGNLIRYYFHDRVDPANPNSEVELFSGIDKVEILRAKEPRAFLQLLKRWVFSRECLLLPHDSHYKVVEERHRAKVAAKHHKATGKELA